MAPLTLERDIRRAIELMETLEQSGEIPASKLAAMKNVLKSDFCRAVREVYEQVPVISGFRLFNYVSYYV